MMVSFKWQKTEGKMKKIVSLLLAMVLVVGTLTACGSKSEPAKTGLAVVTSVGKSASAGEEDGLAQADSTIVAVLVGADGKILACDIDAAQTKVNFSAEGKLLTDVASTFKSKQELKTEYGMNAASSIGKEWNEQADAFAAYVVGKTIEEVKSIAVTEEGVPTDADLAATVTLKVGGFIAAVEKAVANAKEIGANSDDVLGLAVNTDIAKSTDATAEEAGLVQVYSTYSVVTKDSKGKVTSCLIDASQANVNFDATGVITTDLTVAPATKQELGADYGMKKASAIGKEWNEQADAFAAYVVGKTADEVSGIALDGEGLAADADLISSVTVHIGPFIQVVGKALANAK